MRLWEGFGFDPFFLSKKGRKHSLCLFLDHRIETMDAKWGRNQGSAALEGSEQLWGAVFHQVSICILMKILCTETRILNITFQTYETCDAENQGREATACMQLLYAGRSKQLSRAQSLQQTLWLSSGKGKKKDYPMVNMSLFKFKKKN